MLLQTQNVTRRFGGEELFNGITFEIKENARIGLVGRNGAGKSTLLKILANIEAPDEGRVMRKKDLTIGFLDQHGGLESNRTIWEEMKHIFAPVLEIEKRLRAVEQKMATEDSSDEASFQELLKEYTRLQETFEQQNGYGYRSEIKMVLHGFKFYEEDYDKPIAYLSGGQKTRLSLAKLLLQKKDLLILDEPTNHLDIETLSWLENYLTNYTGALVIVSHDRYFLDKLTIETYELSYGQIYYFKGNYSRYLKQKAAHIEKQTKDYEKQQKEIAEMEDFIARNLVRASTTRRAQSRRKQLEKMDRIEKPLGDERSAFFSFSPERQSGNIVLQTKDLTIGYSQNDVLSREIDLDIRKGDVIALIGPNGIGKSTLLRTLVKQIDPVGGEFEYGTKVDIGYYEQEQENLNPSNTVLKEVWDEHPLMTEETVRTFLGSFLFRGEDVEKTVSTLSGGERARVSLAKLALNHDNFLVLDEPTNHLDIDSKEVLENALINYQGTLLFVSHDRYFINRLATKVLEIGPNGTTLYLGDYDYYLHKKEELYEQQQAKEQAVLNEKNSHTDSLEHSSKENEQDWVDRKEQKRQTRRLKREISSIEEKIAAIEEDLENFTNEMNQLSNSEEVLKSGLSAEAHHSLNELSKSFDEKSKDLEDLYEKWEILHLELDEYTE
ncbi:ATP-binding cassette, subfamily F, member 3 [Atopostipes suicloacalis DSM 15692]|uniref:ATP-binding cassette, subfamily F, member 3 n=2 Tax=Atopostipes suicloacalis TaxID=180295 RepID=A0A1M4WTH7_9LACT|nr:ATP-binding cassette, subfamily F, member 3 [Atopostipes suicloacalis DSM 15692]